MLEKLKQTTRFGSYWFETDIFSLMNCNKIKFGRFNFKNIIIRLLFGPYTGILD